MEVIRYVAERIKELRTDYAGKGISQDALASAVGTTANTISRWETGTYKPSVEDLEKLSRFFGVSILKFFPQEEVSAMNEPVAALLRAARDLPKTDVEELKKYAEYRRARALMDQGKKSRPGRPRTDTEE